MEDRPPSPVPRNGAREKSFQDFRTDQNIFECAELKRAGKFFFGSTEPSRRCERTVSSGWRGVLRTGQLFKNGTPFFRQHWSHRKRCATPVSGSEPGQRSW